MEVSPTISVVVPIYKVEDYLDDCISSIIAQDYDNIEIILVDDGSPDKCPVMCDNYAKKDSRIRVIHKTNGGLSDARNSGIMEAHGEYTIFIDSDDFWIDRHFLSKLIGCVRKNPDADLVFFGRTIYCGDKVIPRNCIDSTRVNGLPLYTGMRYLLQSNDMLTSACMKLIRTSIIKDNNIYFKNGMLSEDLDWSLNLYQHIGAIAAIDDNSYGYRKRPGSISSSLSPKHADDLIGFIEQWASKPADVNLQDLNLSFLAYTYIGFLAIFNKLSGYKRKEIKEKLRHYSWLFKHSINSKVKKVSMVYNIGGFDFTCMLLQAYYSRRRK